MSSRDRCFKCRHGIDQGIWPAKFIGLTGFQNRTTQENLFTQPPEILSFQNLFIPGILISILWKIGCLKHLIRSIARKHYDTVDHGAR